MWEKDYLCYEDETTQRVTRIFVGEDRVYAAGVKVTYQIDNGYALERTVTDREDTIAAAPPAALEGYTFVGGRQDDLAEKKVLSEYIISSEEPVTLYAVYKKQMTIRLMPNGGTLAETGAKESFTAFCYYNNGNSQSEPTTVPACPYTRKICPSAGTMQNLFPIQSLLPWCRSLPLFWRDCKRKKKKARKPLVASDFLANCFSFL